MGSGTRAAAVLGAVVFLLLATFTGVLPTVNELQKKQQVSGAQSVEATVLSTNVTYEVDSDDGGRGRSRPAKSAGGEAVSGDGYWEIEAKFRYTVDGKTYVSANASAPGFAGGNTVEKSSKAGVEAFRETYHENATVTAYYLPEKPATAFLVDDTPPVFVLLAPLVLAATFGLPGLFFLAVALGIIDPDAEETVNRTKGVLGTFLPLFFWGWIAVLFVGSLEGIARYVAGGVLLVLFVGLLRLTGPMILYGKPFGEGRGG